MGGRGGQTETCKTEAYREKESETDRDIHGVQINPETDRDTQTQIGRHKEMQFEYSVVVAISWYNSERCLLHY